MRGIKAEGTGHEGTERGHRIGDEGTGLVRDSPEGTRAVSGRG